MVYFDNAATTYPKPRDVYRKWRTAMSVCGANPGRSGHRLSMTTAEAVYKSREICAGFFSAKPENVIFTLNCTHALNYAIKGRARPGCHFVISDIEHNAVVRPVFAAVRENGGTCDIFETSEDAERTLQNARRALRGNTAALVCTAASNVIGLRTPIKALAGLCRKNGVCFILDAAQGAGALPITLDDADIICAAGHKGLYGPMGTGLMITNGEYPLKTIIEGGTGSASMSLSQPDFSPDRFESGTMNVAGVVGLGEGVKFVRRRTPEAILRHELALCERFCAAAGRIKEIVLYNDITPGNRDKYAPVVSFNISGKGCGETVYLLSERGIYMRGGLHCAPLAHKKLGTLDCGTVRFSPSAFNSAKDVDLLCYALRDIILRDQRGAGV